MGYQIDVDSSLCSCCDKKQLCPARIFRCLPPVKHRLLSPEFNQQNLGVTELTQAVTNGSPGTWACHALICNEPGAAGRQEVTQRLQLLNCPPQSCSGASVSASFTYLCSLKQANNKKPNWQSLWWKGEKAKREAGRSSNQYSILSVLLWCFPVYLSGLCVQSIGICWFYHGAA